MKRDVVVAFKKAGRPSLDLVTNSHLATGLITKEEAEARRPPPFQPFDVPCNVLSHGDDFMDVQTLSDLSLADSYSYGLAVPWTLYRLRASGRVSFFYAPLERKEDFLNQERRISYLIRQGNANLYDWRPDSPTWSIDSYDVVLPVVYLLLLANRYDKGSAFGTCPRDVSIMIAKAVCDTRRDPVWIFGKKVAQSAKRQKV